MTAFLRFQPPADIVGRVLKLPHGLTRQDAACRTRSSSSRHANGAICIAGCRVETERSAWTAIIFKRTSSFIGVRHPSGSVCNGYDEYDEMIVWVLSGLPVIPILRLCAKCDQQNREFWYRKQKHVPLNTYIDPIRRCLLAALCQWRANRNGPDSGRRYRKSSTYRAGNDSAEAASAATMEC